MVGQLHVPSNYMKGLVPTNLKPIYLRLSEIIFFLTCSFEILIFHDPCPVFGFADFLKLCHPSIELGPGNAAMLLIGLPFCVPKRRA